MFYLSLNNTKKIWNFSAKHRGEAV